MDPLLFLVLVFAAGAAFGSLLTMTIMMVIRGSEMREFGKCDSETQRSYLGPSKVWLSRAGNHFHVNIQCASLKLEGVQRRGIAEFAVCQHCAKKNTEITHGTENNHEDWAWLWVSNFWISTILAAMDGSVQITQKGVHLGPKGLKAERVITGPMPTPYPYFPIPLFPNSLISLFLREMQALLSPVMPGYSLHGPQKPPFPEIHTSQIEFFTVAPQQGDCR